MPFPSLEEAMYEDFQRMSKKEQIRRILLGGNAEFVLRMTANLDRSTEVGKAAGAIIDALKREVPEGMNKHINDFMTAFNRLAVDVDYLTSVDNAAQLITTALRAGGKVLLCGNGGSAALAAHLAAELVERYARDRAPLAAIALTEPATLTALGNDYGYDWTFARWIAGLGNSGDVLVVISTSGRSPNVLRSIDTAFARGMKVIAMTGADGGHVLREHSEHVAVLIRAPSDETPVIQEIHLAIGHTICAAVEKEMFV
jgi:D-sedoheptulose 7-phosphate isomerase